jgi:hypothetical protein
VKLSLHKGNINKDRMNPDLKKKLFLLPVLTSAPKNKETERTNMPMFSESAIWHQIIAAGFTSVRKTKSNDCINENPAREADL